MILVLNYVSSTRAWIGKLIPKVVQTFPGGIDVGRFHLENCGQGDLTGKKEAQLMSVFDSFKAGQTLKLRHIASEPAMTPNTGHKFSTLK